PDLSRCRLLHLSVCLHKSCPLFFFSAVPASCYIHTLSLHDALPIWIATSVFNDVSVCRLGLPRSKVDVASCGPLAKRSKVEGERDRKSTRLNSSHVAISYAVFCLKKIKSLALLATGTLEDGCNRPPG